MAEEAKVPEEAAQRSKIWLLTTGSRGDAEPAIALSLGLQEKGHTVRVLGPGYMARTFDSYGIDFGTADGPPVRYPGNKVARACLQDSAVAEGFLGEGNVDDYLIDTCLLYQAFLAERILKCHADGTHFNDWGKNVEADGKKFDNFCKTGTGVKEMRRQYKGFLAEVAVKRAKSNELHAATRRESVLRSLRVKARELHRHPVDAIFRLNMCMTVHLATTYGSEAVGLPTRKAEMMASELGDFTKWRVEEDFDFEEWWQHWWSKLVTLMGEMALAISIWKPHITQGLLLTMDAAAPEDRPDLLIFHFLLAPAALALKSRQMVSTLIWWPQLPQASAEKQLNLSFEIFLGDVLAEGVFLGTPGPILERGPFDYMDVMQGPRQMISFSPTFLSREEFGGSWAHWQLLRSCCTGSLVLESKPTHQAGLFSTPEEEKLATQFLALGDAEAPVYIGFGSMADFRTPAALAALVAKSLRLAGLRGIFVAGYSGLDRETFRRAAAREFGSEAAESRLLWLASAPHAWLFERCACTVHHGGMGTCNAALRAGVPTVVAPFAVDQPRNAAMIRSLGCGAVVSNLTQVTPQELASAIKAVVGDSGMKAKAKEVAAALRAEQGLETAVKIVERCVREPEPAPASQRSKSPLKNGSYRFYGPDGNPTPIVSVIQDGKGMLGDNPIAWFRSGSFTFEGRQFNSQCCNALSRSVSYGNVHESGLAFTDSHGNKLQCESAQGWSWLIWRSAAVALLALLVAMNF